MGQKSNWLSRKAIALYAEAEELEGKAKDLKAEADAMKADIESAKSLSPAADRNWAELHAARSDFRQISMFTRNHG